MINKESIEIAERNKRAWEYIRRSQRQREELATETLPTWFNYVLGFSFVGCIGIWIGIFNVM